MWDLETGNCRHTMSMEHGGPFLIHVSRQTDLVACVACDSIREGAQSSRPPKSHEAYDVYIYIFTLRCHHAVSMIVGVPGGSTVQVWDVESGLLACKLDCVESGALTKENKHDGNIT